MSIYNNGDVQPTTAMNSIVGQTPNNNPNFSGSNPNPNLNSNPTNKGNPNQKKPKQPKIRQPHLMLWFVLILIALPIMYIGSNLLTAKKEQSAPVEGVRFSTEDLDPKIEQAQIDEIIEKIKGIDGVENVTGNLLSATLRIHVDTADNVDENKLKAIADNAWKIAGEVLPLDVYFTNHDDAKMYDIDVDVYNFIVDGTEEHSQDKQIYFKAMKNAGASKGHYDYLTKPKDANLVKEIVRSVD